MKKSSQEEMLKVLTIMSDSAKPVLKKIKKQDMRPTSEAENLLEKLKGQNVILYTHPQTVLLYEKLGFRRAKSAMELFSGDEAHLQWMEDAGFFLPEHYRFCDEYNRDDMKGPAWRKR